MECHICHKPLVGRYYIDSWEHKICESHLNTDVVFCSSCTGFTKKDITLADGRILCSICMGIALKPGDPVDPVMKAVVNALFKVGFDDLRMGEINAVEIVSAGKMAELRKSPVNLHNKGLALSNVSTSFGMLGGRTQKMQHTIYILSHLTKIEFAGTLAHEMLHVWQTQNGIFLSPKLTEGLCNMGSYLMYNTLASSLTKIYLKNLSENPDPIYGDGFREIYRYFEELGWRGLIKSIRENKIK